MPPPSPRRHPSLSPHHSAMPPSPRTSSPSSSSSSVLFFSPSSASASTTTAPSRTLFSSSPLFRLGFSRFPRSTAPTMSDEKPAGAEVVKAGLEGGEVLYFGSTAWETMGRKGPATGNMPSPSRLRPLVGVDIRFVASGSASCHFVAVDTLGRCFTWGRNEKGQLGQGDTLQRNLPTVVSELSKYKIVKAGSGRSHTVVVTDEGKTFAFGWNKHGQLGSGSVKNEIEPSPVPSLVSQATNAVWGAEFTVWLSSVEGSSILTAGLPQYGQLGHGTDAEYNSKDGSVRLVYEPQPRPQAVAAFQAKSNVKVACGANHTAAVDSSGFVYTYKKMMNCITPFPKVGSPDEVAVGQLKKYPDRLFAVPPSIARGYVPGITEETYHGFGGFAAAIESPSAWVMNIVPTISKKDTLGIIYERGLIGIYHDWSINAVDGVWG